MYKLFLCFFVSCFSIINSFGQSYDLIISEQKQEIGSITYQGYETSFNITSDKLQKAWWKHTKKFGILDNKRTHYILKIPTSDKTLLPINLIQTTQGTDSTSTIFLAVFDQTNNSFKKQVKTMLLEFKIQYYGSEIQQKIVLTETKLASAGANYQAELLNESRSIKKNGNVKSDNSYKNKLMAEISRLSYELEELKRELIEVR